VVEEFFLDRVAVEPGDGAQPAGDGGPGAAAGFQVAGEAFNVGAAGTEELQVMLLAPAGITPIGGLHLTGVTARCWRSGIASPQHLGPARSQLR